MPFTGLYRNKLIKTILKDLINSFHAPCEIELYIYIYNVDRRGKSNSQTNINYLGIYIGIFPAY